MAIVIPRKSISRLKDSVAVYGNPSSCTVQLYSPVCESLREKNFRVLCVLEVLIGSGRSPPGPIQENSGVPLRLPYTVTSQTRLKSPPTIGLPSNEGKILASRTPETNTERISRVVKG